MPEPRGLVPRLPWPQSLSSGNPLTFPALFLGLGLSAGVGVGHWAEQVVLG